MKNKISYFFLLFSLAPFFLHAQQQFTEEQKTEMRARYQQYQTELQLTPEQSKQVEKINEEFFTGLSVIKNSNESRLQKYRQYKSLKGKKDKQMKTVLDKEQYKKYELFQEQLRDELRENRRNNG
jgi:hypothetical protein